VRVRLLGTVWFPPNFSKLVYPGKGGRLVYTPDGNGNTLPDFSNCGYAGGGVKLPDVAVWETVLPVQGDASSVIQAAIDKVSKMLADEDGFRGAVLIKKGVYKIGQPLQITTGGVASRRRTRGERHRSGGCAEETARVD
jgi:hypothetical protein